MAEYAASEIKADNRYKGRIFTVSGTIKSIFHSGGTTRPGVSRLVDCVQAAAAKPKAGNNRVTLQRLTILRRLHNVAICDSARECNKTRHDPQYFTATY